MPTLSLSQVFLQTDLTEACEGEVAMAPTAPTTLRETAPWQDRVRQAPDPLWARVLLVEPDRDKLAALERAWSSNVLVEGCGDFKRARQRLLEHAPKLLITNLQLGAFNGLHLVYLAAMISPTTRCVVYAKAHDLEFAREIQRAGAFYERLGRLPFVPRSYVFHALPPSDRRDPRVVDRRRSPRGGRRFPEVVATTIQ